MHAARAQPQAGERRRCELQQPTPDCQAQRYQGATARPAPNAGLKQEASRTTGVRQAMSALRVERCLGRSQQAAAAAAATATAAAGCSRAMRQTHL